MQRVQCETVKCESAVAVPSFGVAPTSADIAVLKEMEARKVARTATRQATKKWMPTQHAGNGHVSGVESMNEKNIQKHGDWGTFRFTPHMWPFLPAIGLFKTAKAVSDYRASIQAEKAPQIVALPRNPTAMLNPHPVDQPVYYENHDQYKSLKSIKADRLDAQHMESNCAKDREVWQRCVKDRFNKQIDCTPALGRFRQCQEQGL